MPLIHEPLPAVAPSVHVLGGIPTEGVKRGFDRIREVLPVRLFAEFVGATASEGPQVGVLLPPHLETSQLVEDWEACRYLAMRLGEGARIGNVVTVVDSERVGEQLESGGPISAYGWGESTRDVRTVADIAVGQIESATHLVLVGASHSCDVVSRLIAALNPSAARLALDDTSDEGLREFVTGFRGSRGSGAMGAFARIVPPWLDLLRGESPAPWASNRFLYRRSRPFDPERFRDWLADAPRELVRGKGNVWLANQCDQSFGYSCAGAVHRLFGAGRWWASCGESTWPTCDTARRRLLERWHPHFGDRRQEIAFIGLDHDPEAIGSALDSCLLSEEEAFDAVLPTSLQARASASTRVGLH